jgi:ABC-type nitrate/sulfonate/bicarbonate transport system permease component
MPAHGTKRTLIVSLISVLTGLAVWSLASSYLIDTALLPHPISVWNTAVEQWQTGLLSASIKVSLWRVLIGWAMGVAAGIVTGVVLGELRTANAVIGPIFEFLKGVAPISLVPIMILWFGIGELPKLLIIAYITWVVVTVNTETGVREIPMVRLRAARCLGLSQLEIFYRVILPSAAPYILLGMRSGIGFAYIALVSAEFIAVDKGVGFLIMDSRLTLQTSLMLVGIITLGLMGSATQYVFDLVSRRIPWLARFHG